MIRLQCPGCRKNLGVKDDLAGRLVACPQCKARIRIPKPEPEVDELEEVEDEVIESVTTAARPGRRPPPPKPRPRDEEDEDEPREAVRRSRRPREDEEDEEEEERPRPARKRKKKRRERRSSSGGGMGGMLIALGLVAGVCFLLVVLSFFVSAVALVTTGLGWVIYLVGFFWILGCAFQDSPMQGVLCFFVPFYILIYSLTHFEEVKKPFLVLMLGLAVLMGGSCAGGFRAAKEEKGMFDTRRQIEPPWIMAGQFERIGERIGA